MSSISQPSSSSSNGDIPQENNIQKQQQQQQQITQKEQEQPRLSSPLYMVESNDEKVKRHRELFQQIDTTNKGEISIEDFCNALKKKNHPLKDSDFAIHEIFQSFHNTSAAPIVLKKDEIPYTKHMKIKDSNNNSNSNSSNNNTNDNQSNHPIINCEELNKNQEISKINFDIFNKYLLNAEKQIEKGFKTVDKDHDGKILKKDVEIYLKKLGLTPSGNEIDIFFQNLDNNEKGYLTYEEFRDSLLFMPRLNGSRISTAFQFFNDNIENITSEGDLNFGSDIMKSIGYFIAGGLSGVVSRTCTAPFDRVKVFLIARTDLSSTLLHSKRELQHQIEQKIHHKVSKGKIQSPLIRAAKTIYKQGGIRGFYVGNGLNVIKVFPESAMKFGSFELVKKLLCQIEGVSDQSELSKLSTYLAGGIGGVIAQTTVYPIDTLKYRIQCAQLDGKERGNALLIKTAKDMFKQGGIGIFYRGLLVGISGMFPYAALDLGTFNTVKKWYIRKQSILQNLPEDEITLPTTLVLAMGASSGTFGATMVYPINLIRTRLQAQGTFAHPYTYDGFMDAVRKTVQREGLPGLFKGLVPNLAKAVPAISISYLCYENLKNIFELN